MAKTLKSNQSRKSVSKKSVEVIPVEAVEHVQSSAIQLTNTPDQLIAMALQNGAVDINTLERLMDLQERWIKRVAHEKYREALSKFQEEVPEIKKNKNVNFQNKAGNTTSYNYAPLSEIEKTIKPGMAKHRLSKEWKFVNFLDENKREKIRVTCAITHVAGHKEENSMESFADDSGGKNRIQQDGSAIEYMKRYTLTGALGLTTAEDNDGKTANDGKPDPQAPKKTTPSDQQFKKMVDQVKSGELTLEKIKQHFDLSPVMEQELTKATPVTKQQVDESVLKILINQVRGGLTLEEVKNKFALNESQEKVLETVINSKRG